MRSLFSEWANYIFEHCLFDTWQVVYLLKSVEREHDIIETNGIKIVLVVQAYYVQQLAFVKLVVAHPS